MIKFKSFKSIFLTSVLVISISAITSMNLFAATLETNTYTVKSGDCLSVIAQDNGESLSTLRKANNKWNDSISIGEILNISKPSSPTVVKATQNNDTAVIAKLSSNSVLAYASKFLGIPYVWGGTTPSGGFDCSGFTQYVFAHFGINLPRVSQDQQNVGTLISRSDLQPGDLVFFGTPAHHVGIYVGNGEMINAPHTGAVIRIQTLNSDFTYGRRVN
jgi:cell wall-associated NlpC family hydrolase